MSSVTGSLSVSPLADLEKRCAEETQRFFNRETYLSDDCFEIFRRALAQRDPYAWEAVFSQYHRLTEKWANRHPERAHAHDSADDYGVLGFERMWAAVSPAKFAQFRDLRAVLAYLKMCVHSAIIEDLRRSSFLARAAALDDVPEGGEAAVPAPAEAATERTVLTHEARSAVRAAVNAKLHDDKERVVIHCLYELDLKPKAIYARHPDLFSDVREIYVIRQVVLERLSRDPALRQLAGEEIGT